MIKFIIRGTFSDFQIAYHIETILLKSFVAILL